MGALNSSIGVIATVLFTAILALAGLGVVLWTVEHLKPVINARHRIAAWMDAHAAPEWRLAARLHSVQLSGFWAVLGGLWVALPAFQSYLPPFRFAELCVGFSLAILFARFTGQRGLP